MEKEHCHCSPEHSGFDGNMPDDNVLYDVSELFKVFGDATRIKILFLLLKEEMCVCDIAGLLGMQQSAISHQLRVLKQARLVKFRREGKTVFYSLADGHVETMLSQGLEHAAEQQPSGQPQTGI
ncbi:MAG: winged helix-turn-helix transcriptional regulator [Oscillospiraceae bacterium]|nr:winged helix-turn-helix transcriptional regulator [Oscillospiraceae bacterium]MBP1567416.1 winged helix-turn-helix transcriptional regulator [Oscillospiraceae bacterium]MBP1591085.1 winged helix-turn-helix transcriptional regulator [Oscillospiraceae bacterium]MBQ5336950.1 winged helix-turn-helix transcriptional regulator [Oscillospiraceae bacterium]